MKKLTALALLSMIAAITAGCSTSPEMAQNSKYKANPAKETQPLRSQDWCFKHRGSASQSGLSHLSSRADCDAVSNVDSYRKRNYPEKIRSN